MIFQQIYFNINDRTEKIKHIVIHDTANTTKGANAKAHYNYYSSGDRNSSADFFVDSNEVWKINDYHKYFTWHCGDGNGKNGITNQNSIGVEMCVNSDGDASLTLKNTIELVKSLKKEFPEAKIVRHFDASGKKCPATMSANNWQKWNEFIMEVSKISDWKDILKKVSTDPAKWESAINVAVNAANADGDLGALEVFKYLPTLIEKIYNSK